MREDRAPDSAPLGMLVEGCAGPARDAQSAEECADHAGAPMRGGATFPAFAAASCTPIETALTRDAGRASQPPSRSAVTFLGGATEKGAESGDDPAPRCSPTAGMAGEGENDGTTPAKIASGCAQ